MVRKSLFRNARYLGFVLLVFIISVSGCKQADERVSVEAEVEEDIAKTERGKLSITSLEDIDVAISLMTLEEKAGQLIQAERGGIQLSEIASEGIGSILSGGGSAPSSNDPKGWVDMYAKMAKASRNSSTGIPIVYGIDAVHGHNNVTGATIFPHNMGLGAANNPDLVQAIGVATGEQIKATGLHWNFGPAVSIVQDIRWGRSYESYSEDGLRVADLGAAYVKGLESTGILSTTKHFIGDGYTTFGTGQGDFLIDRGDVTVGMNTLLDIYLPAYEKAIAAGTRSIMISFNSIDGEKMHGHDYLLQDVLRQQLGFDGLIVSDWEAISELPGTLEEQVANAVNAGVDLLMQPFNWKEVKSAIISNVNAGKISEERLNEAVRYNLVFKFEAGLFSENPEKAPGEISTQAHKDLARHAVAESLVLLKNDNNLLPLPKNIKVYLTGPAHDNVGVQCGGWTSSWQGEMDADLFSGISIKDAFEAILSENGGSLVNSEAEADVVVIAIGEVPYAEGLGDTADLALDGPLALEGNLEALEIATSSTKPVLTLMVSGRPRLVDNYINDWDAFVMTFLPGTEGNGITDVLFGDKPFVGTLPITWPKTNEQSGQTINIPDYLTHDHQFKYDFGIR